MSISVLVFCSHFVFFICNFIFIFVCIGCAGERLSAEAMIENGVITVAGLRDAIFVGHIKTGTPSNFKINFFITTILFAIKFWYFIFVSKILDLDSVAGAIGAAALFDGIPAIAQEELNGEIAFALNYAGIIQIHFTKFWNTNQIL